MPNWCSNYINFYSKDKQAIADFHARIEKVLNEPTPFPTAWNGSSGWLGNFLLMAGYSHDEIYNDKLNFNYRGELCYLNDVGSIQDYDYFQIDTETAWAPMLVMWSRIIEKLYPGADIRIAFCADEPGMGDYYRYDPDKLFFADDDYFIDAYAENIDEIIAAYPQLTADDFESCDVSEERAIKIMQRILGTTETDVDVLVRQMDDFEENITEIDPGAYLHFHKYETVNIEDC